MIQLIILIAMFVTHEPFPWWMWLWPITVVFFSGEKK